MQKSRSSDFRLLFFSAKKRLAEYFQSPCRIIAPLLKLVVNTISNVTVNHFHIIETEGQDLILSIPL